MASLRCVFLACWCYYCLAGTASLFTNGEGHLNQKDRGSFPVKKCCQIGEMYQISNERKMCVESVIKSRWQPNNVIESGFPENCSEKDMILLEPDVLLADRFFPLSTGQLVVPHRFWTFSDKHHCIEDIIVGNDTETVKRSAVICSIQGEDFPANATNDLGTVNLDFLMPPAIDESEETDADSSQTTSLSAYLSGKTVVRKCCDITEAYLVSNHSCIAKEGYATQFFDDLQQHRSANDHQFFFRIGKLTCPDQEQVADFQIDPSGRLRLRYEDEEEEWLDQLVHPDDYCLDDFVIFFNEDLPEVINLATYCPNSSRTLTVQLDQSSTSQVEEMVESAVLRVPKCCPAGQISDDVSCQPFKLANQEAKMETIILSAFQNHLAGGDNHNLSLVHVHGAYDNLTGFIPLVTDFMAGNDSWITPIFQTGTLDGNVSLLLHFYVEKYWNLNVSVEPFCVDIKIYRRSQEVFYRPTVFYRATPSHVSEYYPYLLYISAGALVITAVIYFTVPASSKFRSFL